MTVDDEDGAFSNLEWMELGVLFAGGRMRLGSVMTDEVEAGREGRQRGEWGWSVRCEDGRWEGFVTVPRTCLTDAEALTLADPIDSHDNEVDLLRAIACRLTAVLILVTRRAAEHLDDGGLR